MAGTQTVAIVDKLLTNVSRGFFPEQGRYIAERILPKIAVKQKSGLIGKYPGNEHLRIVNSVTGGKNGYREVHGMTRDSDSYKILDHGLKIQITQDDYENVEQPFEAEAEGTEVITMNLVVEKEKILADVLQSTATLTQNTTLTGTDQWTDLDNSSPLSDTELARKTVFDATGSLPNLAIMGWDTYQILRRHPQFYTQLGYIYSKQGKRLSDADLADVLQVKEILVGTGIYSDKNAALNQIWNDNFIYAVAPKKANKRMTTLGFEMRWKKRPQRRVTKEALSEPEGSKMLRATEYYQQLLTDIKCAYLIKDTNA